MRYSFIRQSNNKKTGPIPVTRTERASCPDTCAFFNSGCYAEVGPTRIHWQKLNSSGLNIVQLTEKIRALPSGQVWRHNEAGDLAHHDGTIDADALQALVRVNNYRKGFTYTHHAMTRENQALIKYANSAGFTVNLSANNLAHAQALESLGIAPVCVTVPASLWSEGPIHRTQWGATVVRCPAEYREGLTCAVCKLCTVSSRKGIVGFTFHGVSKNKAQASAGKYKVIPLNKG